MIEWWVVCADAEQCTQEHVLGADGVRRHRVPRGAPEYGVGRIQCPDCGRSSPNPNDIAQGYCGACHWWTSDMLLGPGRRAQRARHLEAAGRYFDAQVGPGLAGQGAPAGQVASRREEFVRGAAADAGVLATVLAWAGHQGGDR